MTPVLERVRKLLALSHSSNPHEAATAAAMAAKLIGQHKLAAAELEITTQCDAEASCEAADPLWEGKRRMPAWIQALAAGIAKLNDVAVFRDQNREQVSVRMVGRPSDTAAARTVFAWLQTEITRLAKDLGQGRGARWRNAFLLGAARGALAAMHESMRSAHAMASSSVALVLARRHELARARLNELHPELRRARPRTSHVDAAAYQRGVAAGKSLDVTGARIARVGSGA